MDISKSQTPIFYIEPFPENSSTVSAVLTNVGYQLTICKDAHSAIAHLEKKQYPLILLNLDIQENNSMDLVATLRKKCPTIPIIILSSNATLESAIQSIQLGVRDYLVKPIAPNLLLRCVSRVISDYKLHRQSAEIINQTKDLLLKLEQSESVQTGERDTIIQRGRLALDLDIQRATMDGHLLSLSPTAFKYLAILAKYSPKPVSFDKLVHEAQGPNRRNSRNRDIARWYIHKLRKSIEPDISNPRHIVTIRGVGYCLIL